MNNILKDFFAIIEEERKTPTFFSIIVLVILFFVISSFDKALAAGLFLLLFLTLATIFIISKSSIKDENIYIVFLMALLVHFGAVLFIYYGHFRPFGGGADFEGYSQTAIEIAGRFSQGNFSLAGLYANHFFPILIGVLYMVTFPSMIVGQFFTVWLAAVSIVLVYLIVLQIGGTKKIAFAAAVIASIYPSYLYFGSVLLKDTVVIPLVFLGIFLILKMVKNFSWFKFLLFFIILTCLINLRFYIGHALMFTFIFSWPLLSTLTIKKKVIYWLVMVFLLGFSPQIVGDGYYASNSFKKFLNPKSITYYRETLHDDSPSNAKPVASEPGAPKTDLKPVASEPSVPKTDLKPVASEPSAPKPSVSQPSLPQKEPENNDSTFVIETGLNGGVLAFLKNSFQAFTYSLLGPFPWQFRNQRQMVGLAETIPWYVLIVISLYGGIKFIKKKGMLEFLKLHKFTLPLLLFGFLALGALSLFINNYGIIARVRIPMFICFVSMMFLSFDNDDYEKIHAKISHYWRDWFYRFPPFRKVV